MLHTFRPALHRFALLTAALLAVPLAAAERLDEQRAAFRDVYPRAELGDWDAVENRQTLLSDYVLWPDLRAAFLRARLSQIDDDEVREFLERYESLKPARALRYRFALHLAASGQMAAYRALYQRHYRDLGVARLDCLALQADLAVADGAAVSGRARDLWLVGHSQADECDPVFEHLKQTGELDEALYRERFELAIKARSLSLARYLARALPESCQQEAARWTAAYGKPQQFLSQHDPALTSDSYRRQLVAAVEMLAYDQPLAAARSWDKLANDYPFSLDQRMHVERHIALWVARNHEDTADAFLLALPDAAVDTEVRRWRIRIALGRRDWPVVLARIERLPAEEQAAEPWRYWRGIALQQTRDDEAAAAVLEPLAGERSYYGFLAADAIDADYAWSHRSLPADGHIIRRLAAMPELIRARELFLVDLESRGRSEWDAAVKLLSADEQVQAALLAHRWGWNSRAIATAARNDRYDDLHLRYPLPYADKFEAYSAAAGIRLSWAYGIARSESLFMRDIRSSAGAIGLMQLTPSTGRRTARAVSQPYAGRVTLMDPDSNIRLGTWYLGQLYERFGHNRVLATAAYNAGPLRVERWLPPSGDLDARIWLETIPYQETRDYVRRVLAADTLFHWRMAGEMRRLSGEMPNVAAAPRVARAARY